SMTVVLPLPDQPANPNTRVVRFFSTRPFYRRGEEGPPHSNGRHTTRPTLTSSHDAPALMARSLPGCTHGCATHTQCRKRDRERHRRRAATADPPRFRRGPCPRKNRPRGCAEGGGSFRLAGASAGSDRDAHRTAGSLSHLESAEADGL